MKLFSPTLLGAIAATLGCAADPTSAAETPGAGVAAAPGGDALVTPRASEDGLSGVWHLAVGAARATLSLTSSDATDTLRGTITFEESAAAPVAVEGARWDTSARALRLSFEHVGARFWLDARVLDGVMVGRFARGVGAAQPEASQFTGHLTGWSAAVADRELFPRVWDLRATDGTHAKVRIDREATGALVGTFKVYARDGVGAAAEELEHDLDAVSWDGERLRFQVFRDDSVWRFDGAVEGRSLRATAVSVKRGTVTTWSGARAEVLSHGIASRTNAQLAAWRVRAREALSLLMMNGAPAAIETRATITELPVVPPVEAAAAFGGATPERGYNLSEIRFEHTLADPHGGPDIVRASHAWLAIPAGPAPTGGYPLVIGLNGHGGSAAAVMYPWSRYWYGDAYARRGYMVLAVDVSHRPASERSDLYADYAEGDDPQNDNGTHSSIASAGFDTDWEEDGERAWDAMRALDYALDHLPVRDGRVLAAGLSMGAEVATVFGGLDTRVDAVVAAGFSPDFGVMRNHGNHPCWRWRHADIEEYIDASDLHGLVAPRLLVVETGAVDNTFSALAAPFASDKQVIRRSRSAFGGEGRRLYHDLHPGAHVFHVGDPLVDLSAVRGITVPSLFEPTAAAPLDWQIDATTRALRATVFDLTQLRERD